MTRCRRATTGSRSSLARAKDVRRKAAKAEKRSRPLAAEAKKLAVAAGQAASAAERRRQPDRRAEAAPDRGAGQGPEHLGRSGHPAPRGARADRPGEGGRGGQGQGGRRAGSAEEAGGRGQEEGQAAPRPTSRTPAPPTRAGDGLRAPAPSLGPAVADDGSSRRPPRSSNPAPEPVRRRAARHRLRQGAAGQALPVGRRRARAPSTARG